MKFVGSRDQQRISVCATQVLQIFVLSFTPKQLFAWITRCAVRAGFDSIRHPVAEHMANSGQSWKPALILNRIVQQGSYRLILVAASLKDKGTYAHQVGNVGDRNAFSGLLMMQAGGELQSEVKSPSQEGRWRLSAQIAAPVLLIRFRKRRGAVFNLAVTNRIPKPGDRAAN